MPGTDGPSLHLGFDPARTQVLLRAAPGLGPDLARLASGFPQGRMRDALSAAVPLDDLLSGIEALGTWPHPETVKWEQSLLELARDVLDDAQRAEKQLDGNTPGTEQVDPEQVPALLGPGWRADLTGFQRRNIARLLSLSHGADFSVPGAGKTREALAVFAALRHSGRVRRALVVCPKSAFESWRFESEECFTQPLRTRSMDGGVPDPGAEVLLVNYERLDRALPALAGWLSAAPAMLVLDEAHRMKLGSRGVYGAACMSLGPLSRRRLILTGTPAPNGSQDLENLLAFVWPGHGRRAVTRAVAGGDLAHASRVLKPLYTRTTKNELGLPPTETRIRRVAMPPLHSEIYSALVGQYSARAEGSRADFDALGRAMLRLLMAATSPALLVEGSSRYEPLAYQVPALKVPRGDSLYQLLRDLPSYELSPKYQETLGIVADNAAAGRKTLVWASFVRSLTTLESVLAAFRPAVVHGGTPDRDEAIRRFRNDPDCMVLLSNPATLGEGISLHQVCHDAVYVDRDFQAGRFLQSLDRIHRLGLAPDTHTRITVLAAEATIDEIVADRLEQKLEFMGKVLDDPEVQQLADLQEEPSAIGGMDIGDIRALLQHLDSPASARPAA